MLEIQAGGLQAGDEFTTTQGVTWHRVVRVSFVPRKKQDRVIVYARPIQGETLGEAREHWFDSDHTVITR